MISVTTKGKHRVDAFAKKLTHLQLGRLGNKYGKLGVDALAAHTPVDTGRTVSSWDYIFENTKNGFSITWTNNNTTSKGTPIIVFIQYGHTLPGGGYVQGVDVVNPAMKPIFENLAKELWSEVTKL